ncbi:hypothetical protein WSM22_08930 [Cytophagales bacterium WSM2-2]|nr:hypothetical protein WSM22_08930 [Cytophagales bacterium WSM2-2]
MKKYSLLLLVALSIGGCDDFLNRPPLTSENDATYWTNENNVRLFANGFYSNYFVGYNTGFSWDYVPGDTGGGYCFADDFTSTGKQAAFEAQAPSSRASTTEASGTSTMLTQYSGPLWNFSWVRKSNLFLDRVTKMKGPYLNDEAYAHWSAVARFFRAYEYSRLVSVYGNVPYFGRVVGDSELSELYKDRDDRAVVMDAVYDDFVYVLSNMRLSDNSNAQYLNRYIAAGFISRFMLFEGTWQKYQAGNTTKATKYLQLAVQAGDMVIQSGKWKFTSDFRSLFGSDNLSSNPEVLLYRTYDAGLAVTHSVSSYSNLAQAQSLAANLSVIKSFIAYDGKPYQSSGVANANQFDVANLIKTRDPRFEATFWKQPRIQSATLLYVDKFIDRVGPTYNTAFNSGEKAPAQYSSNTNTSDAPVMRLAEVALNWIEAKAELETMGGTAVSQGDLDASINAIRKRPLDATAIANGAHQTASLSLAAIPNDPSRDADVSPLLWEIRRERRMEFVFEHTRLLDIKRWKKIQYMDGSVNPDILLGPWVDFNTGFMDDSNKPAFLVPSKVGILKVQRADGTVVTYDGTNAAQMVGYYLPQGVTNRDAFSDRVYMAPLGVNDISQYTQKGYTLTQTPGW